MVDRRGLRVYKTKEINGLKVITYANKSGRTVTVVKNGRVLFESIHPEVSECFATLFPELIERKFETTGGTMHSAWFAKAYPTHMLGTVQYDIYRGLLVRFKDSIEGQPQGFIKIY